jgi:uncharacterized protein
MDVALALTHDCNLACSYCYAGEKRHAVMAWETAEAALAFAFSFAAPRLQLGFFGGEPLLEWDLLVRCTERAEALSAAGGVELKPTVTTNATLLTAERVEWLHAHRFYPALSIDGDRAMHEGTRPFADGRSSYDACLHGLRLARESFPEIEVILVPDPTNVTHLAGGVRALADGEGVLRLSVNPNFYARWDEAALAALQAGFEALGDFYLERYRAGRPLALNVIDSKVITRLKNGYACRDRCNFGEREIAVAPSGRLYPCERLIGDDRDLAMCIGDVRGGFDEAKRAAVLARRGNVNAECLRCACRSRCMNWCCCINYTLTGAIDRTDGIVCFHERAAIAVADRVAALLYAERNPAFLKRFYYDDAPRPG